MNSCILMVTMISDPELRNTRPQDGGDSLEVTTVWVEFESTQPDQPAMTLKVVGWRKIAEEIKKNYAKGDRAIVQGRLGMNTIERNGIKEKKAELVVSRIYPVEGNNLDSHDLEGSLSTGVDRDLEDNSSSKDSQMTTADTEMTMSATTDDEMADRNLDSIPF